MSRKAQFGIGLEASVGKKVNDDDILPQLLIDVDVRVLNLPWLACKRENRYASQLLSASIGATWVLIVTLHYPRNQRPEERDRPHLCGIENAYQAPEGRLRILADDIFC